MSQTIKEIWNGIFAARQVKNVVWKVEGDGGLFGTATKVTRKDAMLVESAAELYHAGTAFANEIKRLRKALVENNLAEYNSDGKFVEKFQSDTESNLTK